MQTSKSSKNMNLILRSTSGKLWLKMRRMSIIWHVLHFFDSSLRLTSRMDLIQRALDTPDLVDYFSYPHHDQKVHKKVFRGSWRQKLHSKVMKVRNFEMLIWPWKMKVWLETFFWKSLKKIWMDIIHWFFHSDMSWYLY